MAETYSVPEPEHIRSPLRFLVWLAAAQPGRSAAGACWATLWMVGLAVPPYLLSSAIDQGLVRRDRAALACWALILLAVGTANAALGITRHRTMTRVRMDASYRIVWATVRHAVHLGASLPGQVTAGEVVTIGMSDVRTIAQSLTVVGPGVGSLVGYVVVAFLLFSVSPLLAGVILAGVPIMVLLLGPQLRRLARIGTGYREQQGLLTARLVDVIGGLRVLGGLGGREVHAQRFRRDSAHLRERGYRVAAVTSWVGALGTGLPALFLAAVTWIAAHEAAQGSITVGDLIAVYGYVAVLVVPVSFFIESAGDIAAAVVCARRVIGFLSLVRDPASGDPGSGDPTTRAEGAPAPRPTPPADAVLCDPESGVEIPPGLLTAIAGDRSADAAAVVERLGRYAESAARWGAVRLDEVLLAEVRGRILLADNEADLFAGTLREVVAGRFTEPDDAAVRTAMHAAAATDVLEALPDGLDGAIGARGRNLSGGQRQRIRLARALYADPDVLLAVEPTSAVDAHTENVMASRLRAARAGRTTVVTTGSPLVLEKADRVLFLVDGRLAASGPHALLLRTEPAYHALVSRVAADDVEIEGAL